MQFLLIALCLTGYADDGNLNSGSINGWSPVDATITFSVVNTWTITWATQVLGLTTWESGSTVNIVWAESTGMKLGSIDPASGTSAGEVPKPAGCGNGFGVSFNDNLTTPIWHINSWQYGNLWYTEDLFTTWQTITNPAGTGGRGMSYDGDQYWQSNSTSLMVFTPGGASQTFTNAAPTQISGVAVVPGPNPAYTYVLITTYNTDIFILYSYDGSTITQEATGTTPGSLGATNRYGLTYSPYRESLFFSYPAGGGYRISEMTFDVTSLTRDSWAGIKSSF